MNDETTYEYRILYPPDSPGAKKLSVIISACGILEADKEFEALTGLNPAKPPKGHYIGVSLW